MATRKSSGKNLNAIANCFRKGAVHSDFIEAEVKTMQYYIRVLLPKHFEFGNTRRQGYKPNKTSYEM